MPIALASASWITRKGLDEEAPLFSLREACLGGSDHGLEARILAQRNEVWIGFRGFDKSTGRFQHWIEHVHRRD